jgi:hypothetical protein
MPSSHVTQEEIIIPVTGRSRSVRADYRSDINSDWFIRELGLTLPSFSSLMVSFGPCDPGNPPAREIWWGEAWIPRVAWTRKRVSQTAVKEVLSLKAAEKTSVDDRVNVRIRTRAV